MRKIWKPIAPLVLLTLFLLGVFVWLAMYSSGQELLDKKEPTSAPTMLATSEKPLALKQTPIVTTPPPASPDETNEKEENARAQKLLNSENNNQRIEGLELIGAYPTPVNEAVLIHYLRSQENPEIRSTAALSLSTLETPTTATIEALLDTLKDASENVRFSALSTLEDYLAVLENNSPTTSYIQAGLRAKLQSKRLPSDIAQEVDEILGDR